MFSYIPLISIAMTSVHASPLGRLENIYPPLGIVDTSSVPNGNLLSRDDIVHPVVAPVAVADVHPQVLPKRHGGYSYHRGADHDDDGDLINVAHYRRDVVHPVVAPVAVADVHPQVLPRDDIIHPVVAPVAVADVHPQVLPKRYGGYGYHHGAGDDDDDDGDVINVAHYRRDVVHPVVAPVAVADVHPEILPRDDIVHPVVAPVAIADVHPQVLPRHDAPYGHYEYVDYHHDGDVINVAHYRRDDIVHPVVAPVAVADVHPEVLPRDYVPYGYHDDADYHHNGDVINVAYRRGLPIVPILDHSDAGSQNPIDDKFSQIVPLEDLKKAGIDPDHSYDFLDGLFIGVGVTLGLGHSDECYVPEAPKPAAGHQVTCNDLKSFGYDMTLFPACGVNQPSRRPTEDHPKPEVCPCLNNTAGEPLISIVTCLDLQALGIDNKRYANYLTQSKCNVPISKDAGAVKQHVTCSELSSLGIDPTCSLDMLGGRKLCPDA